MGSTYAYRIYDSKTGDYINTRTGKTLWHTPAAAKNAARIHLELSGAFKDYHRFKCHKFELICVGEV